jgi:hypothetical protein
MHAERRSARPRVGLALWRRLRVIHGGDGQLEINHD